MTKAKADETAYLWQNIPKALWTRARAKSVAEGVHLKDVLKDLLEQWVSTPERIPDDAPDATPTDPGLS